MAGINDFRSLHFHPYNIMMILIISGLSMLFVGLTGAYLYTRVQGNLQPLQVPFLFIINTILLIISNYTLQLANKAYQNDDTVAYKKSLLATIILTILFMIAQCIAWYMMYESNIKLMSGNMAAYLYAISILHFLHIIGGLPFMLIFLWVAHNRMKEPVSVLVYFTDPMKRLKLKMLTMYWYFLDILWVYLVLFFYINYLIQ